MDIDKATLWLRSALKVLFIHHPVRTSLGVMFGSSLHMVAAVWADVFPRLAALTALDSLMLGVFTFNAPLLLRRNRLSEEWEEKFAAVEKACRLGNLSVAQRRLLYLNLANEAVAAATKMPAQFGKAERFVIEKLTIGQHEPPAA